MPVRVREGRLILPKTRIVVTGTANLDRNQREVLIKQLDASRLKYPRALWITGACVGVDEWAAIHLHLFGEVVYTVVPYDKKAIHKQWRKYCSLYERMPITEINGETSPSIRYMARNQRMVNIASMPDPYADWNATGVIGLTPLCLAFPDVPETNRDGTWATVRRARKAGLRVVSKML